MIQDGDLNSNVDADDILLLLDEGYAEYFMDELSTFDTRKSYVLISQSHDTDTPTYMEALSGENCDEYYKEMYDEIQSLMIKGTGDIFSRKSVADPNKHVSNQRHKCDN